MKHTELYRVFYYAAQCQNITDAASKLYISQPAVSKSIKKLEEQIGCSLFFRSSRGVTLTAEGQTLYEYVKIAFDALQNGENKLDRLKKRSDGLVKLGISNTLCKYFFMPHLEAFHKTYPGIRIQIMNRTSPDTLRLLDQGAIDFGIVSIPMDKGEFDFIELMTVQDTFVAGRMYAIDQKIYSIGELAQYPLMMMEDRNLSRTYIDDYLSQDSKVMTPEIEVSSMELLIDFAKMGLGIAAVIREFIIDEISSGILKEIPLLLPLAKRKIGIAVKKQLPTSLAAETFITFIEKRTQSQECPIRLSMRD